MHIECPQEKISEAVGKAGRITSQNLSLPVLKCVLLKVEEGRLVVSATDLEIGIEISLPIKVEKSGAVAVPADPLHQLLTRIPSGTKIELMTSDEDNTLQVKTDSLTTNIKTFPTDDFPSIPRSEDGISFTLPASSLHSGLSSVWYAASPSSMKPELSSVYMHQTDEDLVFVATDSFRLAEKTLSNQGVEKFESILIPHENVSKINRIFTNTEKDISLNVDENQVGLETDSIYVTSRIIDGTFPDYHQIIPTDHTTEVVVLKEDFSEMLKLSSVFSDKFNKVTIDINIKDDRFALTTANSDVGENTGALPAKIEGDDISMNFNHRYISDCLSSVENESLKLLFSPGKPMVITGAGDESFKYLVMPMSK